MSSRGFRDQLGRGSMRSTAIIALVSTFLVMAGAVGLHRVTASRAVTKTAALPARHLSTLPAGATATNDGKIVGEFASGYKHGDRLLRPARVQVGKAA